MQPNSNGGLLQLLPMFVLMFVIWYFVFIKPEQKKQKERKAMIDSLKKNDEIVTAGGIHGTIVNVKEKTFVIRVDENARIEIDKSFMGYVLKKQKE